jgi:hypothetical protein
MMHKGQEHTAPDPRGVSGGGIIYTDKRREAGPLVAIATEHRSKTRLMRCVPAKPVTLRSRLDLNRGAVLRIYAHLRRDILAARLVPCMTKFGNNVADSSLIAVTDTIGGCVDLRGFIKDGLPDSVVNKPLILRIKYGERDCPRNADEASAR